MTSPLTDLRFGGRTAAFAAYTVGTLARYEVESRGMTTPEAETLVTSTMLRYGRAMCGIFGLELDAEGAGDGGYVRGADDSGFGRVFVCNHRSALDIFVTFALLAGRHVSRADLARWPLVGFGARRAGVLFVEREDRRSAAAVVRQMIGCVERGLGVIIFPEGTTYEGDEVRPFKPGAFAVSRRTGCEIIPVGVAYGGSDIAFGDENILSHMRRVAGSRKTPVAVTIGAPFRPEGADTPTLSRRTQADVQRLVHASRRRLETSTKR